MTKVQQYFKDYAGKEKCFETSDGLIFHEKGDANLHASSLKDDEVKTHTAAKNTVADDAGKASGPAKIPAAKTPLTAKEVAQAKVDGLVKALEKAKTPAAKAKVQTDLDAANVELTDATAKEAEKGGAPGSEDDKA